MYDSSSLSSHQDLCPIHIFDDPLHQSMHSVNDEYHDPQGDAIAAQNRKQVLKHHLFEEKIDQRESDDIIEFGTYEFQSRAISRKRTAKMAEWMDRFWEAPNELPEAIILGNENITLAESSALVNAVYSMITADGVDETGRVKRRRIIVRRKKAQTGFVLDDIESVSSVDSEYLAELTEGRSVDLSEVDDDSDDDESDESESSDTDNDTDERHDSFMSRSQTDDENEDSEEIDSSVSSNDSDVY
jgi:hypothetical protein